MGEKKLKGRGPEDTAADALVGLYGVLDDESAADFDLDDVRQLLGQEGMGDALISAGFQEGEINPDLTGALTSGAAVDRLQERTADMLAELGTKPTKE